MGEIQPERTRIEEVLKIIEDHGMSPSDGYLSWEGDDLEDLRRFLTEEEFQRLMDELESGAGEDS
jgi:hypothetical protein